MFDLNPVFIPGPINMPERLRQAMDVQTRDYRVLSDVMLLSGRATTEWP